MNGANHTSTSRGKGIIPASLRRLGGRLWRDRAGNTLAVAAVSLLLLLAAVGGGVDMSRAYMTKTNLQAACDSGVLAGRRALSKSGTYGDAEKAKAAKMFNFNMHAAQTSSKNVSFETESHDDGSVTGTASATMPMTIMDIFGGKDVKLDVACSAELQMASADVMFVLDVTGSMAGTKIQGLRDAVRDFHKTVSSAVIDKEKTVIRYAFVPYSQTVNTSGLTGSGAMKASWFPSVYTMATKIAVFNQRYNNITPNANPGSTSVNETMTNLTSTECTAYGNNTFNSGPGTPIAGGGPPPAATTSTAYAKVSWTQTSGKNVKPVVGTCVRSKKVTTTTYTSTIVWGFSGYEYGDADVPTDGLIPGGSLPIIKTTMSMRDPGYAVDPPRLPTYYVSEQGKWDLRTLTVKFTGKPNVALPSPTSSTTSSCIEERKTVMDFTMDPVPDGAWDLKINDEPLEADDTTKWRAMWRDMYFTRTSATSGSQAPTPACPAPMRQFEAVDTTDPNVPGWMDTYLNNLVATGSTYHDIGMIWGARLASTKGMFADNVLEGDRTSVSRHIIFMTDGNMEPTNSAYSAYGVEGFEHKVAPANSSDGLNSVLASYHNNRFLAACRRAKEEGYTIWLIGFGTSITNVMKTCSSAERAFQANDTTELKNTFRYIAGQVADLRINK